MESLPEVFAWSDLAALGLTPKWVRRKLRSGRIRRVTRGIYVDGTLPDTLELRVKCIARALPPHAVLCDRSAAWLWGVNVHDPDERFAVPPIEFVSVDGHEPARRASVFPGKRDLAAADIAEIGGLKLTTPARTAADIACLAGRTRALAVLDAFRRQHGLDVDDLWSVVTRMGGRRGVIQLRELVPLSTALAESPAESWTRMLIIDAGLPAPIPQVEVGENGIARYRIDLAYPQWRIAIEYFGEEFHGPEHAAYDQARLDWLRARGWHVIVVRKEQLAGPKLDEWLGELGAAIAERSSRGKRRHPRGNPSGQRRRR